MLSIGSCLLLGALLAFVLFGATWVLSRRLNNYSFVDAAWALSLFLIVSLYHSLTWPGDPERRLLTLAMAALWSLRLGGYLVKRIRKHHPREDVRYEALRTQWAGNLGLKFFMFFQAQAVLIVLLSVPMLLALRNPAPALSWIEQLGFIVWLVGFLGESVADRQMESFKHDPSNKGKVCNVGLWRYSRHPNYFFESVIWWGFWIFACGSPWGWATIYAPLLLLHFLLRVTGIPLTEKCAVESKGEAYREYQRTTSAFVPWFPKKNSSESH
jgi:steroid 5-alpha reductase family enzyme